MNATQMYDAVMASPDQLDDEIIARIWCLVHGKVYDRHKWTDQNTILIYAYNTSFPAAELYLHERPDISTDAALDLVRMRFPDAEVVITDFADRAEVSLYTQEIVSGAVEGEEHKDRRLAVIAALLKAMGA